MIYLFFIDNFLYNYSNQYDLITGFYLFRLIVLISFIYLYK